jgi:hypothetical protein
VSGQLHGPAALSQGKSSWYSPGGPQSQSMRGEEKNSQYLPGLEPPTIQPVAQRYSYPDSAALPLVNMRYYHLEIFLFELLFHIHQG